MLHFRMSTETTIRIVDVFSVSKKTEKNGNRESERYIYPILLFISEEVKKFGVFLKTRNLRRKFYYRLSEAKPEVSDFDEDVLVSICMKIETYG